MEYPGKDNTACGGGSSELAAIFNDHRSSARPAGLYRSNYPCRTTSNNEDVRLKILFLNGISFCQDFSRG